MYEEVGVVIPNPVMNIIKTENRNNPLIEVNILKKEEEINNLNNNIPTQTFTNTISNEIKSVDLSKSSLDENFRNNIYCTLDKLVGEINDRQISIDILKKIHTILMNIIANPEDSKFRRLKIDSNFVKTYIGCYNNAVIFLKSINFDVSKDGQYYENMEECKFISNVADKFHDYLIDRSKKLNKIFRVC